VKVFISMAVGAVLLAGSTLVAQDQKAKAQPTGTALKDVKQKASYALGLLYGTNLKKQAEEIDPELFAQGFRAAISGEKPLLSLEESQEALKALGDQMKAKQAETSKVQTESNKTFLAENKTKPGVKTTPSGLQYKVLKEGTGRTPKATDTVSVNYRGTFVDGKEFDSSEKHGGPASFPVNKVIKGWTEALQLMKEGGKLQLFIPAELAYGANPPPGIPPNSTLLFDVELLTIK